jgi:2-polyprenyl-3-methyl-5-hydroxy-6-metoxy-1,4-benzoquinol methylase
MSNTTYWECKETTKLFQNNPPSEMVQSYAGLLNHGSSVLDLGCGGGRHTKMLLKMGHKVHFVDKYTSMIQATLESIGSDFSGQYTFQQGSIVDFAGKSQYDMSVVWGVFHQAESYEEFLNSVLLQKAALKQGGMLLANVFAVSKEGVSSFNQVGKDLYRSEQGVDTLLLKPELILDTFSENGFEVMELELKDVKIDVGTRAMLKMALKLL